MDLYMKILVMVIGHSLVNDHFVVRTGASVAKQLPPAAAANSPGKTKDIPKTVTSSSTTTVPTTTTVDRDVPEFELARIVCSIDGKCVFALQNVISRSLVAQFENIVLTLSVKDWCSGTAQPTRKCCEELGVSLNAKSSKYVSSDDYRERIVDLLNDANCRLSCNNDTCSHVACKVPHCVQTTHSPSSLFTFSSSLTFPLTSDATTARAKGDGGKAQSIVIIVVTCVVAFLAGVGGAFLVICLRKRWKRSDSTSSAGSHSRSVGLSELPRNPQLSATKTDVPSTASSNKNDYSTTAHLSDSEHIYNCITDHQPTNHQTSATATTTTTTETSISPHDNFRITHLPERKLPTAPTPSEAPHLLAEMQSRDGTARAGSDIHSDYCLAKRPEVEGQEVASDREKQGGKCSVPPAADYFVLEDEARKEDRLPMEREGRSHSEKDSDTAQETTGQYFTLEREEAEGEERNDDDDDDDEGRQRDGRERIISRASDRPPSECYSPLDLSSGRIEESEYTSLDLEEAEERGREATRDYLDVLP